MPNTHSTLTALFTDIASAIREKDGTSTAKVADAFPAAIRAIPSGGGTDVEDAFVTTSLPSFYSNSRVSKIGQGAFAFRRDIVTVEFNNCKTINSSAFRECRLTTVSFPVCETISASVFYACTQLSDIYFPKCSTIGNMTFYNNLELSTVSFPECIQIGSGAFSICGSLSNISFPKVKTVGYNAFTLCTALYRVLLPAVTMLSSGAFLQCSNLQEISVPICSMIGSSAFQGCYSLSTLSLPGCQKISAYAFAYDGILLSLYLLSQSMCNLQNSNAFRSTPIAEYTSSTSGVYGSIFVPMSLLSAYQSATNWTYFSSRFVGV